MEFALDTQAAGRPLPPLEPSRVAEACRAAIAAIEAAPTARAALDGAIGALHTHLEAILVAALVSEHDRLWLVGDSGFAMSPDGIPIGVGIVGRAMRTGRVQYVPDLAVDPDYFEIVHGVTSELAVPIHVGDEIVGVVDIESAATLPRQASRLVRPLAQALAPVLAEVRHARTLDLPALARLFVYVSSLREPREISEIVVASLVRILPIETAQLFLRVDDGSLELTAVRRESRESPEPLTVAAVEALRGGSERWAVIQEVDVTRALPQEPGEAQARSAVLLPLRANGDDLGVLVGTSRWPQQFDRAQAEVAAVLAAQGAASLDAALALGRERRSALTDPLTSLLNRRGFEVELDNALAAAQGGRSALSLWVLDCDDFKEVNDRAGHEFGDALLREIGHVLASILPDGARAGRLGGDEFVVMLPGADAESAERIAVDLRAALSAGLEEAGFPLRISGGVSTYPFDGGSGSQLMRAADQALYEAKATGKNRVVSFRELLRDARHPTPAIVPTASERQSGRVDVTVLVEATEAATAIAKEGSVGGVLDRLCKTLTFVVGATACLASRVEGGYVIDEVAHSLRTVEFQAGSSYLIDDFPVTKAVLDSGEARAISFLDEDLDRAEAFVLREVRMNCALLLPIVVADRAWGLIELYDMRLRRYSREQQAVSLFLVSAAARRIEALGAGRGERKVLPLYRPPESVPPEST